MNIGILFWLEICILVARIIILEKKSTEQKISIERVVAMRTEMDGFEKSFIISRP